MLWPFVTKAHHEREVAEYICDLDEAEEESARYRNLWLEEERKTKNLQKQLEDKELIHRDKEATAIRLAAEGNKYMATAIEAKSENVILRQILEDLTGKSADDLIEAHKRAVRKLEYGVREDLIGE